MYWLEIVMQCILLFFVVISDLKKCGSHLIEGTTLKFEKATVGRFLRVGARKNISILESLKTCLKNCLWLLLYLSFISPLRTVMAMSVNTNRILDS